MPRYEYQCVTCKHRFELRQGFDADSITDCPICGAPAHRRFNSVAVIYKGSGFYTTDYGRKHLSEAGPSTNGTSEKSPSTPSETSGEATPAKQEVKSGEV